MRPGMSSFDNICGGRGTRGPADVQWSLTAGPSTHLPDSLKYQPTNQPSQPHRVEGQGPFTPFKKSNMPDHHDLF